MFEKRFWEKYCKLGPEKMFEKNLPRKLFETKAQEVLVAQEKHSLRSLIICTVIKHYNYCCA